MIGVFTVVSRFQYFSLVHHPFERRFLSLLLAKLHLERWGKFKNTKEQILDPLKLEPIAMAEMLEDNVQRNEIEEQGISGPVLHDVPPKKLQSLDPLLEVLASLQDSLTPSTASEPTETADNPHPAPQGMGLQTPTSSKHSGDSPKNVRKKQKQDTVKEKEASTAICNPPQHEVSENVDGESSLQYKLGILAWYQWITGRNAASSPTRQLESDILKLTVTELNHTLCLLVQEIRKPNGLEYAPDTIYYLCLGIQTYLFKQGHTNNIFYDAHFQQFIECFDKIAKRFSLHYNRAGYIVTRVIEEHLWESKQLGAHCPYVLLNTIMFINTKHFNLGAVDDHMQYSFLKAMKHWNDLKNDGKLSLETPRGFYEFYISKCPESVKTRNDIFYLLPEQYCTLDSPVWFSTTPLPQNTLQKMLNRIKIVREINAALLYNY